MVHVSSETQGQLLGAGKSLNGGEKKLGLEKCVLDFSSPDYFSRPFRLFPAPLTAPRVSENADNAELGHFTLLFCRGRQQSVPRFITHVHSHCSAHYTLCLTMLRLSCSDDGDAWDDAQQKMDLNFTLGFRK